MLVLLGNITAFIVFGVEFDVVFRSKLTPLIRFALAMRNMVLRLLCNESVIMNSLYSLIMFNQYKPDRVVTQMLNCKMAGKTLSGKAW